jgi:hypothetical protein
MQLALSLAVATANPAELARSHSAGDWPARRRDFENRAWGFARQFEAPSEGFQVGVDEALLFSNGPLIENEYLNDSPDRLVGALAGLPGRQALVEAAFLAVLSRPPEAGEAQALLDYLTAREDRQGGAISQIVWSLVASGEFRFNH